MKDYCLELASKQTTANAKLNLMREYLQAYILRSMHEYGVFRATAFLGGTALRFLYGLGRFSEDLDFSLTRQESGYTFSKMLARMKEDLLAAGYALSVTYNDEKTVNHAFFRFGDLLYEAGISPLKSQKLSIKLEIDTNPPQGAILQTQIINKYFPLSFLTYDLESLFAGKLHAVLSREYLKGRDYFDLGWYLSRWKDLNPNIELLANALRQTKFKDAVPTMNTWRQAVYKAVHRADWDIVKKDVENFLENQADLNVFTKENVLGLLKLPLK
jgi:predicted nucleotidyltransferase component of viral defense system